MLPVLLTDTVTTDLDRAVHYTLLWGLEGVELRTVGGPGSQVPFVNEAKLKRRLSEAELPAAAVVPGMFQGLASARGAWMNEIAAFEETLQFCKRIDCSCIVVSAFAAETLLPADLAAEALQQAGALAARHGMQLAVLNEHDMAHATGAALAALLDRVDHPAVGAAWSPAAALQAGEDPAAGLAALGTRVMLVRCRDGVIRQDSWSDEPLGQGGVDWLEQLRLLRAGGFDGPLSLEVATEPSGKQGLHDATRLIAMIRESRS